MGRTKEASELVSKVGFNHGFIKISNNDFVFNDYKIIIRSTGRTKEKNGYHIHFLGITYSKLRKACCGNAYLLLVLEEEQKILYIPVEKALEILENFNLTDKDQIKFQIFERGTYFAISGSGGRHINVSQFFNAKPF